MNQDNQCDHEEIDPWFTCRKCGHKLTEQELNPTPPQDLSETPMTEPKLPEEREKALKDFWRYAYDYFPKLSKSDVCKIFDYWWVELSQAEERGLQRAVEVVKGWHIKKGGYGELAHQIGLLSPQADHNKNN